MTEVVEGSGEMESAGQIWGGTEACRRLFESCLSTPLLSRLDWLEDRRGEFNLWAGSLNAAKIGRSSLDYRVRNNPDVGEMICDLLGGLEETLTSVYDEGIQLLFDRHDGH